MPRWAPSLEPATLSPLILQRDAGRGEGEPWIGGVEGSGHAERPGSRWGHGDVLWWVLTWGAGLAFSASAAPRSGRASRVKGYGHRLPCREPDSPRAVGKSHCFSLLEPLSANRTGYRSSAACRRCHPTPPRGRTPGPLGGVMGCLVSSCPDAAAGARIATGSVPRLPAAPPGAGAGPRGGGAPRESASTPRRHP